MEEDDWQYGSEGLKKRLRKAKEQKMTTMMMLQLKACLVENEDKWEKRRKKEVEEMKRMDKEDRMKKIEIKRKKYGRKNTKYKETKEEKRSLDELLQMRIEIAEIKENMWKNNRNR